MQLTDLLEIPVSADANENVSKVASRMIRSGSREVIVTKNDKYIGMLFARSLSKRNIANPDKTNISQFVTKIRPIPSGTSLTEAINHLSSSDHRAVPVVTGKEIRLFTWRGMFRSIRNDPRIRLLVAKNVMTFPYCIGPEDDLKTAKSMMRELNVSGLPVIENRKPLGIIGEFVLLRTVLKPEERTTVMEDIESNIIASVSVMRKNFLSVRADSGIRDLIDLMVRENQTMAVVGNMGEIEGIITRKDIIKAIGTKIRGTYVSITGVSDEDGFSNSLAENAAGIFLKKIQKFLTVDSMGIHIKRYKESGPGVKYSVKVKMATNRGLFVSEEHGWKLERVLHDSLVKVEGNVIKRKERFQNFQ